MPYILALDVSMGHSYSVLYKDDTCLFEDEIEHTQRGFHALLEEIQHLPERPLIVLKQRDLFQTSRKVLSRSSLFLLFVKPVRSEKQMEETPYAVGKQINRMPIGSHRLILKSTSAKRSTKQFYLEMRDLARFIKKLRRKSLVCAWIYTTAFS